MVRILVVITTSFVPYGGLASVMMNFYRAIDKTRFHIDFASTNLELMLSRLVDTFFSRTSWTMLLYAENHSISVA